MSNCGRLNAEYLNGGATHRNRQAGSDVGIALKTLEARQVQTKVAHSDHPEHGCDGCDSKSCSYDADPEPIVFGCRGHEDWDQGFTGAEHENDK